VRDDDRPFGRGRAARHDPLAAVVVQIRLSIIIAVDRHRAGSRGILDATGGKEPTGELVT
jgi:hypothetical protein